MKLLFLAEFFISKIPASIYYSWSSNLNIALYGFILRIFLVSTKYARNCPIQYTLRTVAVFIHAPCNFVTLVNMAFLLLWNV